MGKIHVMPDTLASQVAAGEVVERPESVVRELLDNAIDAGARRIELRIERGGRALIGLTDDGSGMTPNDALLAFERHATSKLRSFDDFAKLTTLGFRGEALPSIASVSRFRLRTREHGALSGTLVEIEGGIVREVREEGCAPGTAIEVRDIFFNVPARRRFLKTEATEFSHIDQRLRLAAAGHPAIGFTLWHNGRELLRLPANQSRAERATAILGTATAAETLAIHHDDANILIEGLATRPGWSRPTRRQMIFFVNGRPVDSPILRKAVAEAYEGLIERGTHPAGVIHLEMPPAAFDVNIHPAKREIRFARPADVHTALLEALDAALSAKPAAPPRHQNTPPYHTTPRPQPPQEPTQSTPSRLPETESESTPPSLPDSPAPQKTQPQAPPASQTPENPLGTATPLPGNAPALFPADSPPQEDPTLATSRHLGQVLGSFELFEAHDGLVLLERRAAVERILFEWLTAKRGDPSASQQLLIPATLELDAHEMEEISPHLKTLSECGFTVEPFGPRALAITAVPAILSVQDPAALALLVFEAIRLDSRSRKGALERRHLLTLVVRELAGSGRAVAEFGDGPTLLKRLLACDMPYCCPRGRPTLVNYGRPEIKRRFGL